MTTFHLTAEHGYLFAGCISTGIALMYIGTRVGLARRKVGLKYPALYYDNVEASQDRAKHVFNCTQRGHQNLMESYTFQLLLLLLGGIKHPLINAVAALVWSVGAISFAAGYATGEPDNRYSGLGVLVRLPLLVGLGTAVSTILTLTGVL